MIKEHVGDLLSVQEGTIIHGCNSRGVMGSGVAKQIRAKYPVVYNKYMNEYTTNGLPLGSFHTVKANQKLSIVNMITQDGYGYDGKEYASITAIELGMERFARGCYYNEDVHFPLIGCGLGGLKWKDVSKVIKHAFTIHKFEGTLNLWKLK